MSHTCAPPACPAPRSPVTWRAIEALLLATGTGDYDTMVGAGTAVCLGVDWWAGAGWPWGSEAQTTW